MPDEKPEPDGPDETPPGKVVTWLRDNGLYLGGLAAFVVFLVGLDPISRMDTHQNRMILAGVTIVFLVAAWWARKKIVSFQWPWKPGLEGKHVGSKLFHLVWIAVALYAATNYYQHDREVIGTCGDYNDATYYYLNSKYFDELGYTHLYQAMLVADNEGTRRFRRVRFYRDLAEYERFRPRRHAIDTADEVRSRFTPERWRQFRHDLEYFTDRSRRGWTYFFSDHGYNPPPSWTLVGGTLSQLTPVERLKWLTMADFLLVALMLLAIGRVFGGRTLLVASLFFLVTFSGRWPILGQSVLRFDWFVALVMAVVCLKRKYHGLAGAFFVYATLNRVFPGVFVLPYLAVAVRDVIRTRSLPQEYRRFLAGVIAAGLVFGVGALIVVGPQAFVDSARNLRQHGSPDSFSSHRVGLGDALVYEGEWSRRNLQANGGVRGKSERLWELYPYTRVCGIVFALFIIVYAWRSREKVHRLIWLSIYPLFCLTTPQINYYNLRLLLVLYHMERWREPRHLAGLILLFLIEVATQLIMVLGAGRYTVTVTTSFGLCLYLTVMALFLVRDLVKRESGEVSEEKPKQSNKKTKKKAR